MTRSRAALSVLERGFWHALSGFLEHCRGAAELMRDTTPSIMAVGAPPRAECTCPRCTASRRATN